MMPSAQFFGLLAGGIVALIAIITSAVAITRGQDRQTYEIAMLRSDVRGFNSRLQKLEQDFATFARSR